MEDKGGVYILEVPFLDLCFSLPLSLSLPLLPRTLPPPLQISSFIGIRDH